MSDVYAPAIELVRHDHESEEDKIMRLNASVARRKQEKRQSPMGKPFLPETGNMIGTYVNQPSQPRSFQAMPTNAINKSVPSNFDTGAKKPNPMESYSINKIAAAINNVKVNPIAKKMEEQEYLKQMYYRKLAESEANSSLRSTVVYLGLAVILAGGVYYGYTKFAESSKLAVQLAAMEKYYSHLPPAPAP
jgi:hypothetical protein